ncbi:MAG: beta-propeller fold lactonase family protein [Clostridia bacterium]|nr:beta-propeller fold lactonase family protein [Clostridia bacterium]
MEHVYLLSCAPAQHGGGVHKYSLTKAGKLTPLAAFPCEKPMYAVRRGDTLHVLLRYENEQAQIRTGACLALGLDAAGDFLSATAPFPSRGEVPCHLTVIGDDVYLVNYITGNVVKNGQKAVHHAGRGPHAVRQATAHTHFVELLPDGFLGVCDLGTDTLRIYDRDLKPLSAAKVPDGHGIRHFVTAKKGDTTYLYAVNELMPSVSRFVYQNGRAVYLDTVEIPCERSEATAAAIRLSSDGRYLYVSVRAENIIAVFAVGADGSLTLLQTATCGGDGPRDFLLIDGYLVCANQFSSTVTVFGMREGKLSEMTDSIPLADPLCVLR